MRHNRYLSVLLPCLMVSSVVVAATGQSMKPLVGSWTCVAETGADSGEGGVQVIQAYSASVAPDGRTQVEGTDVYTVSLGGSPIPVTLKYRGESQLRMEGKTQYSTPLSFALISSALPPELQRATAAEAEGPTDSAAGQEKSRRAKRREREAQSEQAVQQALLEQQIANLPDILGKQADRNARRRIKDKTETAVSIDLLERDRWNGHIDGNGTATLVKCQRAK